MTSASNLAIVARWLREAVRLFRLGFRTRELRHIKAGLRIVVAIVSRLGGLL